MLSLLFLACTACGTDDKPVTNNQQQTQDMSSTKDETKDQSAPEDMSKTEDQSSMQDMSSTEDMKKEDMTSTMDMKQDMKQEDMMSTEDMSSMDMQDMSSQDMASEDMKDMASQDMASQDMTMMMDMTNSGFGSNTCTNAPDITAGGTLMNQTTVNATDDYEASFSGANCPNGRFSGPDVAYSISPMVTTTYKITVTPDANFDPMIYVKTDCNMDACLDGTILFGAGETETLTLSVMGGTTAYIIVDGELGSSGGFELKVEVM